MNQLPKITHDSLDWRNDRGQRHRDGDLPAVIYQSGSVDYFKHGQHHRDGDKPAAIRADGSVMYYRYGKLHREGDLPAIIFGDGSVEYWKNDIQYKTQYK
jgi:ribosomal protein L25 (general stress protein Ctc)